MHIPTISKVPGLTDTFFARPRLLVLLSQRSLPVLYSLTAPPPPPPPGEEAVQLLLRAIRTPLVQISPDNKHYFGATGAPSFLSAGLPRDRRGRIARKPERTGGGGARYDVVYAQDVIDGVNGEDTPRLGGGFGDPARDREREILESLRCAACFFSLIGIFRSLLSVCCKYLYADWLVGYVCQ